MTVENNDAVPTKPSDDEIADLLFNEPEFANFNDGEVKDEEEKSSEGVEAKATEPVAKEEEVPAGAEPAAPPAAEASGDGAPEPGSAPAPVASEVEMLRQQLEEMNRKHEEDRELWKQSLQRSQVQEPAKASEPAERKQVFALSVPDKLGEELFAEDPATRQRALVFYTNALAHEVYHKTREDLLQEMHAIARNTATGTVAQVSERDAIAKDFYGKFPELAQEKYGPHIMNIAAQVMSEMNTNQWSAKVRDEVGRRSKELFGVSSTTPTAPAAKPAVASVRPGNGSRAPVVQPKSRQEQDIASLLGFD